MNKKEFGSNDVISVYKFMEMCGLRCEMKKNISISHEIMIRKLRLRNKQFPNVVLVPTRAAFRNITTERVKIGNIILVKDDYKNIIAYNHPRKFERDINLNDSERESVREKLINEYLQEENEDSVDGEKITRGYANYLYKKDSKTIEEEQQLLLSLLYEEQMETKYDVTEKVDRESVKLQKRKQYY